ncbi:MAG: hypothetical protein MRZ36_05295 [Eubacterium sp.]|nr:hypothetical protein [Eubacterium sp.]
MEIHNAVCAPFMRWILGGDVMLKVNVKGYFTVEATFITAISIWVLIGLMYGGFYVHDRVVLSAYTCGNFNTWIRTQDLSRTKWEDTFQKDLNKKLFLLNVKKVSVKQLLIEKRVSVSYQIPIAWGLLKRLWQGNQSDITETFCFGIHRPAQSLWAFQDVSKGEKEGE